MPSKGYKQTIEHKGKISKAHKGYKFSEKSKRKISKALEGKRLSLKHRRKLSKAHKGMKKPWVKGYSGLSKESKLKQAENRPRGKNHWNWKGGITLLVFQIRNSFKYRQWRSDILTRDDFTCQECSQRGGYLEAHHCPKSFSQILREYKIKTFEEAMCCEELWNINGGITFCRECHKKTG